MTGFLPLLTAAKKDLPENPTRRDLSRVAKAHAAGDDIVHYYLVQELLREYPQLLDIEGNVPPGWEPEPLDLESDTTPPEPELLNRSDGPALLYRGHVHSLYGEPESGKTWIALHAVGDTVARGERVVYFDFEMTAHSVAARLKSLGVTGEVLYVRPHGPLDEEGWQRLAEWLSTEQIALAIFDGVTEAMTLHGWDPNDNTDAAELGHRLRMLADTGPAVLQIDHVPKSKDNRPRGPIGAQHKLAAVDVAILVTAITQPDPSHQGRLNLTIEKDRNGQVRRHCNTQKLWSVVDVIPDDDTIGLFFNKPGEEGSQASGSSDWQPTWYMEQVSRWFQDRNPALLDKDPSNNEVTNGVKGKAVHVRKALASLVKEGYVNERRDGIAIRYQLISPYRKSNDEA
jgi:hypothetical protein